MYKTYQCLVTIYYLNHSCNLLLEEEQQGEAIAVDAAGLGFYTTSEGKHQPIYYYEFT